MPHRHLNHHCNTRAVMGTVMPRVSRDKAGDTKGDSLD